MTSRCMKLLSYWVQWGSSSRYTLSNSRTRFDMTPPNQSTTKPLRPMPVKKDLSPFLFFFGGSFAITGMGPIWSSSESGIKGKKIYPFIETRRQVGTKTKEVSGESSSIHHPQGDNTGDSWPSSTKTTSIQAKYPVSIFHSKIIPMTGAHHMAGLWQQTRGF